MRSVERRIYLSHYCRLYCYSDIKPQMYPGCDLNLSWSFDVFTL